MDRLRVGVIIPALNEAATITSVVTGVLRDAVPIVVDDGSNDETGRLAQLAGATIVGHATNRGYDRALDSGFVKANELACEYAVTMDADGQHDPKLLQQFISALDDGADVVVGIRDRRQRFAEHVFAWVGSRLWGLSDPLCGMKAYRIVVYRELGHFDSYDSIGTELAIYAARVGKRIAQLPVKTRVRLGAPRFGKRFQANYKIFVALWRTFRKRPDLRALAARRPASS